MIPSTKDLLPLRAGSFGSTRSSGSARRTRSACSTRRRRVSPSPRSVSFHSNFRPGRRRWRAVLLAARRGDRALLAMRPLSRTRARGRGADGAAPRGRVARALANLIDSAYLARDTLAAVPVVQRGARLRVVRGDHGWSDRDQLSRRAAAAGTLRDRAAPPCRLARRPDDRGSRALILPPAGLPGRWTRASVLHAPAAVGKCLPCVRDRRVRRRGADDVRSPTPQLPAPLSLVRMHARGLGTGLGPGVRSRCFVWWAVDMGGPRRLYGSRGYGPHISAA